MKPQTVVATKKSKTQSPGGPKGEKVENAIVQFEESPEGEEVRVVLDAMRIAATTPRQRIYRMITGGYYRLG